MQIRQLQRQRRRAGWWLLELLLTISLVGALMAAGVMTFYQMMGQTRGMFVNNTIWQNDLMRLMIDMEDDGQRADAVVAFYGSHILENGAYLSSPTHKMSILAASGASGDIEVWDTKMVSSNGSNLLAQWMSNDATITSSGLASETRHTIVFLKGANTIYSVVYMKIVSTGTGVVYYIDRLVNNGGRLVPDQSYSYTATGSYAVSPATAAQNDQQESTDVNPRPVTVMNSTTDSYQASVVIRPPSPISRALIDMTTGGRAREVKKLNDWRFILSTSSYGRWAPWGS